MQKCVREKRAESNALGPYTDGAYRELYRAIMKERAMRCVMHLNPHRTQNEPKSKEQCLSNQDTVLFI